MPPLYININFVAVGLGLRQIKKKYMYDVHSYFILVLQKIQ